MGYEKKIDIPFGAFDSELYYQEINIPDGFEATIKDNKVILERKESEDERIRKWLIAQLQIKIGDDATLNNMIYKAIVWLEKQGKQKSIWHNEYEEPKRGSLILLIMQNKTPIVAKIIEPHHTFNHGERWAYIDDLLEKQGEQEPQGKTALEAINEEKVDNSNKAEPKDYNSIDPHFAKPTDMVEPKLKIESGKWYVCIRNLLDDYGNRAFCKGDVYLSEKDEYLIPCNSNVPWYLPYCVDTYFRNWTIKDARNGDVLNSPSHRLVWIYKDNEHYHVCVNMNYVTKNVATNGLIKIPSDACPATKNERTILFEKTKEAGYEWDAEKKELKIIDFSKHLKCNPDAPSIIEQKPA